MKTDAPTRSLFRPTPVATALVLAVIVQAGCGDRVGHEAPVEPGGPRQADHHLHISTPFAAAHLDQVLVVLGERQESDPPSTPRTAEDALAAMDRAGVELGLVLSNAYMLGMPEGHVENEVQRVRDENAFIAEQVSRHTGRLIGLCSMNPLEDYAVAELERCAQDGRIGGLKLHFANSDVDLRSAPHRAVLADFFARADALQLPLVIHLRTREPEYGELDARLFIDSVVARTESVPIQIAHMAGWGGYDDATDAALGAFAAAMEEGRIERSRLTFGLGAVVFDPEVARSDTATARAVREANGRLAERIQALGPDRVVYGTDWPSWPPVDDPAEGIARNLELIRRALPLSDEDMRTVLGNVGPIFGEQR